MKMMVRILLLTVLVFAGNAFAQNAVLTGKVVKLEKEVMVPVEFAKVLILREDSTVLKGATTNFDGEFRITAAPGKTLVAFRQPGLKELIVEVELVDGKNEPLNVTMQEPISEIITMHVTATRTKTSDAAVVEDIRNSDGLKSAESSEQIAAKGSGNTQEALTKMSGINATNSVLYIRGMGDRYNVAYLNGLPVPSPNPELRVIPMDIFPTSIIDVLEVGKMMAPNLYGDFAGGAINIKTKRVYRTPTLNISLGSGFNSQVTGNEFTSYNGGTLDFFGFDDGTRSLPDQVYQASMQNRNDIYKEGLFKSDQSQIGAGFANNFNPRTISATPATSFQLEGGNYKKFKKQGAGIGFVSMLSHSTGFRAQNGSSRFVNKQNQLQYNFDTKREIFSTSSTALTSISTDFSENWNLGFNYLFINNSDDVTFQSWGYHRDFGDDSEVYSRRYTYNQNQIHNLQLTGGGKDLLKKRLNVNYGVSQSFTKSGEPDRRQLSARYNDRNDTEHYQLLALDANHTHRFFSNLNENEKAAHVDADFKIFENKSGDTVLSSLVLVGGADFKSKERSFKFRQFNYRSTGLAEEVGFNFDINNPGKYFTDENARNGLFKVEESANPGNAYQASQTIYAGNLGMRYVYKSLELIPNLRTEYGFQNVLSRNQQQPNKIDANVIEGVDFMPSLTAKFNVNQNMLLRYGASRTITRPKFFEVAPFVYIAQIAGMEQVGNPNLKNGTNYNSDLRFEVYSGQSSDMVSIGAFGKVLIDPIEQIMLPSAGGQIISFANTNRGTVAGVELEYSKNLSFLVPAVDREKSALRNFAIAGNTAYMFSQIVVNDTTGFTTNPRRPLQGASPFVNNISLKFDKRIDRTRGEVAVDPMKIMVGLSHTYSAKSLFAVGTQGMGDQYQEAIHTLNAVVKLTLNNRWALSLKGNNLTNNTFKIVQEDMMNIGEYQEINSYRIGADISMGLTYKLPVGRKKAVPVSDEE